MKKAKSPDSLSHGSGLFVLCLLGNPLCPLARPAGLARLECSKVAQYEDETIVISV